MGRVPELLEGKLALSLGNITVQDPSVLGGVRGGGGEFVRLRLGLSEHHHTAAAGVGSNDVFEDVLTGGVGIRHLHGNVTNGSGGAVAPAHSICVVSFVCKRGWVSG